MQINFPPKELNKRQTKILTPKPCDVNEKHIHQVELSFHLAYQSEVESKRALLWMQEDRNVVEINVIHANYIEFREVGVLW